MSILPSSVLVLCYGGHWGCSCKLPHCMRQLARGLLKTLPRCMKQWVVGHSLYIASLHGALGSGAPLEHCLATWDSWQWGSFTTLPHCMGHWAVRLPQYIASLHGVVGLIEYIVFVNIASLHGLVDCGDPSVHCLGFLLHIASLHGLVGSGYPCAHCLTTWGSGRWGSCITLPTTRVPERLGSCGICPTTLEVGSGYPSLHGLWGPFNSLLRCRGTSGQRGYLGLVGFLGQHQGGLRLRISDPPSLPDPPKFSNPSLCSLRCWGKM